MDNRSRLVSNGEDSDVLDVNTSFCVPIRRLIKALPRRLRRADAREASSHHEGSISPAASLDQIPPETHHQRPTFPAASLAQMPPEILEMIIARIPFDLDGILSLRLVNHRLYQTLPVEGRYNVFGAIAVQWYLDIFTAFHEDQRCSFHDLVKLQAYSFYVEKIISEVAATMTAEDHLYEASDWEGMFRKGLYTWQRFNNTLFETLIDPRSLLAEEHVQQYLSTETQMLLRYVAVKLGRCLQKTFREQGLPFHVRYNGPWRSLQYIPEITTAFALTRPSLQDIYGILTEMTGRRREDQPRIPPTVRSGKLIYVLGKTVPFARFLYNNQRFRLTEASLMSWICSKLPGTGVAPFLTDPSESQRLLEHYRCLQLLFRKMLQVESINGPRALLSYAMTVLNDGSSRGKEQSEIIAELLPDPSQADEAIDAESLSLFFTEECDPLDILHAGLLSRNSGVWRSTGGLDGVFRSAIREMNAIEAEWRSQVEMGIWL